MITKGQCPECQATAGELHKPGCSLGKPLFPLKGPVSGRVSGKTSHLPEQFWVILRETPHDQQRYDTCGDWYTSSGAGLVIKVSHLKDRREMFLIAIHELIEAFLCECAGITEISVDEFDKNFDHTCSFSDGRKSSRMMITNMEPGDSIDAPYYKQHQIASAIERILAAEVGVSWLEYSKHIEELSK